MKVLNARRARAKNSENEADIIKILEWKIEKIPLKYLEKFRLKYLFLIFNIKLIIKNYILN